MRGGELAPGRIVAGTYAIRSLLGATPWASTYGALTEPNRDVALKMVSEELVSAREIAGELRRIREVVRSLPAHFVLPSLAVGSDAEARAAFIVSPLSPTPSLRALVEICPLTPREASAFLYALGRVIDAAHRAGLFHLALKPTNVFVGPPPDYGVHVGDFESNVLRTASPHPASRIVGADWQAPEQGGLGGLVDARADVFSAALLAFFAMTRGSFWRSCEGHSTPDLAAWTQEVSAPRARATERAKELAIELPASLDAVFERALANSLELRFATVGELADAFEEAVEGRPRAKRSVPEIVPVAAAAPLAPAAPRELPDDVTTPMALPSEMVQTALSATDAPFAPAGAELADPIAGLPARSPSRVRLFAGVGIAFLVLVVGTTAAALVVGRRSGGSAPDAALVVATQEPSTTPVATESAAAAAATATDAPDTSADAGVVAAIPRDKGEIVVTCTPECERVLLDGRTLGPSPARWRGRPGVYGVRGLREGYVSVWQRVVTSAGESSTVALALPASSTAPPAAGPPPNPVPMIAPRPTKAPCGKFLKRCD